MKTTVKATGERVDVYRDGRLAPTADRPVRWQYREFGSERTWDEYDLNVTATGVDIDLPNEKLQDIVRKGELATAAAARKRGRPSKQQSEQPEPHQQTTLKRKTGRDTSKIRLNELQLDILRRYFPTTDNAQLATLLGISESSLHRMARKMKLKKTAEFMKACNENTTRCAHEANKARGYAAQKVNAEKQWEELRRTGKENTGCFKPGHHIRQTMTDEQYANAMRKAKETRNRIMKQERARLVFGLPQKTRYRLTFNPLDSKTTSLRYNMKKKGYLTTRDDRTIYFNAETRRSRLCEEHATEIGIKIEQWKG